MNTKLKLKARNSIWYLKMTRKRGEIKQISGHRYRQRGRKHHAETWQGKGSGNPSTLPGWTCYFRQPNHPTDEGGFSKENSRSWMQRERVNDHLPAFKRENRSGQWCHWMAQVLHEKPKGTVREGSAATTCPPPAISVSPKVTHSPIQYQVILTAPIILGGKKWPWIK